MKTLRKIDLTSMKAELQVLHQEEERSVLGGGGTWTVEDFITGLQNAGYTGSIDMYGDSGSFSSDIYSSGNYMGYGYESGSFDSGNYMWHGYESGSFDSENYYYSGNYSSQNNDSTSTSNRFNFERHNSWQAAFEASRYFSQRDSVESGGYVYPDSTAVFITDALATDSTMRIPFRGADGAEGWFHYHPSGNTGLSSPDSAGINILKERFNIEKAIIITRDSVKIHTF